MRRIWLGFAWILFGILLIPIINPPRDFWGWASLLCGIIGLVLVLLDNKNKD